VVVKSAELAAAVHWGKTMGDLIDITDRIYRAKLLWIAKGRRITREELEKLYADHRTAATIRDSFLSKPSDKPPSR